MCLIHAPFHLSAGIQGLALLNTHGSVCMTGIQACPLCCLLPSGHYDSSLGVQFQWPFPPEVFFSSFLSLLSSEDACVVLIHWDYYNKMS